MKRIWGFVFAGGFLAAGATVALSACAHDDSTLFVRSVLAPQAVAPGTGCAYTSDPTQPYIASGVFDTDLRAGYEAVFLVGNQLVPRGDPTAPQNETSYVNIQGAIITINNSDGTVAKAPFTRLASVVVPPSNGTSPGYAAIPLSDVIPPDVAVSLPGLATGAIDRVVVFVKFFGDTLGGQYVESDNFEFPVDVCAGCLIGFSVADVNPCYTGPNCYGNPAVMNATVTVPCSFEDFSVDCAACKSYLAACLPPATKTCVGVDGGAVP